MQFIGRTQELKTLASFTIGRQKIWRWFTDGGGSGKVN